MEFTAQFSEIIGFTTLLSSLTLIIVRLISIILKGNRHVIRYSESTCFY